MTFQQNHKSWASNTALRGKIVHEDDFEKMTISEKSFKQRKDDDFSKQETKKLAAKFDIPLENEYYPALFLLRNIKDTYTYSSFERDLEESSLKVDKFAVISEGHKNNYIIYSVKTPDQAVKVYRGLSNKRLGGFGQTRIEYIEHFPILKAFRDYTTQHAIKKSLGSSYRHHSSGRDARDHDHHARYEHEAQYGQQSYDNVHRGHGRSERHGYYPGDRGENRHEKYPKKDYYNSLKESNANEDEYHTRKHYKSEKKHYEEDRERNYKEADEYDNMHESKTSGFRKRRENYDGPKNNRNDKRDWRRDNEEKYLKDSKSQNSKESKIDKATSDLIESRRKKNNAQKFGAKKKTIKDSEFKENNEWNDLRN